jgi:hypothetical protein
VIGEGGDDGSTVGIGIGVSGDGWRVVAVAGSDGICWRSRVDERAKLVEDWFTAFAEEDIVGSSSFMGMP